MSSPFLGAASVMDCEGMGKLRVCHGLLQRLSLLLAGFLGLLNWNLGFTAQLWGLGELCSFCPALALGTPELLSRVWDRNRSSAFGDSLKIHQKPVFWEGKDSEGLGFSILPLLTSSTHWAPALPTLRQTEQQLQAPFAALRAPLVTFPESPSPAPGHLSKPNPWGIAGSEPERGNQKLELLPTAPKTTVISNYAP